MSYKCEKCNKIFTKKYNLTVHLNRIKPCNINNNDLYINTNDSEINTNDLKININELNINSTDDLNVINTYFNIKKIYTCINCDKIFNKKSNYLYHINKKN